MKSIISTLTIALLSVSAALAAPPEFFPFDSGVGRGKPEWTPDRQAEALKAFGYDGIGYNFTTPEDLDAWNKALDARGLKLYSIYVGTKLGARDPIPPKLVDAIALLKGRQTLVWLNIQKDKAVKSGENDEEAVKIVRDVCAMAAKQGVRVALYGHFGFYVEDTEDCLRILEKSKCENLSASFNLCHELFSGNQDRLVEIIRKSAPRLALVSINGADPATKRNILRLDQGALDVASILTSIRDAGYKGPVGLQCYGVPGEVEENLKANMDAWKKITRSMN